MPMSPSSPLESITSDESLADFLNDSLSVTPVALFLHHPLKFHFISFKLRNKVFKTQIYPTPASTKPSANSQKSQSPQYSQNASSHAPEIYNDKFAFEMSCHERLFDVLKVDVFEARTWKPQRLVGRARINLNHLTSSILSHSAAPFTSRYAIHPKAALSSDEALVLGYIDVEFRFLGALTLGFGLLANQVPQNGVESPVGRLVAEPLALGDSDDDADDAESDDQDIDVCEFQDIFSHIGSSAGLSLSGSSSASIPSPAKSRLLARAAFLKDALPPVSSSPSEASSTPVPANRPSLPPPTRHDSLDISSMMSSLGPPSSISTSFSRSRPISFSGTGFKEFSQLAAGFFQSGWQMSKRDFAKCLMVLNKIHAMLPESKPKRVISTPLPLKIFGYFLTYAQASYGSLVMNYFGHGRGIIDLLRFNSDKKCAMDRLSLPPHHLLAWDYGTGLFRPCFFIAYDEKIKALVISIRGSWSFHDALTDVICEYVRFKGGYIHKGMLHSAEWLWERYFARILEWVKQFKPAAIYLCGHSMGGAVASILAIFLSDHIGTLISLSHNPSFKVKAYAYGPPPCFSEDLHNKYLHIADTLIHGNEVFSRLSYGSVTDFKEIVKATHAVLKSKLPSLSSTSSISSPISPTSPDANQSSPPKRKSTAIRDEEKILQVMKKRQEVLVASRAPKLFVPGRVFHMYKKKETRSPANASTSASASASASASKESNDNDKQQKASSYYRVVVEETSASNFLEVVLKDHILLDHFPNRIERRLRQAYHGLEGAEGVDGDISDDEDESVDGSGTVSARGGTDGDGCGVLKFGCCFGKDKDREREKVKDRELAKVNAKEKQIAEMKSVNGLGTTGISVLVRSPTTVSPSSPESLVFALNSPF